MDAAELTLFLLALLAAGVPSVELIRVEPILKRAGGQLLTAAFCQRVRRLLLVTPSRGRPPSPEEIAAYEELRAVARARRVSHLSMITEYAVALAPRFRRRRRVLLRVVSFLTARLAEFGDLDSEIARSVPSSGTVVRYMCTAHGCRASVVDILDFLDHVHDEHM
jgi:hypothetical protein